MFPSPYSKRYILIFHYDKTTIPFSPMCLVYLKFQSRQYETPRSLEQTLGIHGTDEISTSPYTSYQQLAPPEVDHVRAHIHNRLTRSSHESSLVFKTNEQALPNMCMCCKVLWKTTCISCSTSTNWVIYYLCYGSSRGGNLTGNPRCRLFRQTGLSFMFYCHDPL